MFFIPGVLISILTFPGVIVHELAHQLFCRLYKIPVFEVVYFKTGNPAGYVLHEVVPNKFQHIMISIGPFLVNTVLGAIIAFPAVFPIFKLDNASLLDYMLIYLGVSIAMHAFPSRGDAQSILDGLKKDDTPILAKIFGYPIVGLIYLGSLGSFFWLDALYGVAVCVGLPNLIISLLS
jgi:hypothetical protein